MDEILAAWDELLDVLEDVEDEEDAADALEDVTEIAQRLDTLTNELSKMEKPGAEERKRMWKRFQEGMAERKTRMLELMKKNPEALEPFGNIFK